MKHERSMVVRIAEVVFAVCLVVFCAATPRLVKLLAQGDRFSSVSRAIGEAPEPSEAKVFFKFTFDSDNNC